MENENLKSQLMEFSAINENFQKNLNQTQKEKQKITMALSELQSYNMELDQDYKTLQEEYSKISQINPTMEVGKKSPSFHSAK
jgi:hypothetical protein